MSRALDYWFLTLNGETVNGFKNICEVMNVQAVEYKPFLRFALADALDKLAGFSLGRLPLATFSQHCMELHNDGTSVNERTDFVLMMKMA